MRPLVVVGDALLDRDLVGTVERLSPDAPVPVLDQDDVHSRPGGAGLAAALAAEGGRPVTLITAVGRDRPGAELRTLLGDAGVELIDVGLDGPTPEKIRVQADGRSLLRVDRGDAGPRPSVGTLAAAGAGRTLLSAAAVLVSDYGRGMAASLEVRAALDSLVGRTPIVWDPHPRGPAPVAGATVATPNDGEVRCLVPEPGAQGVAGVAGRLDALLGRWRVDALCATLGPDGALLVRLGEPPFAVPAPRVGGGDPCGAGDRFAARVACALGDGVALEDAALDAVACASAYVAAGGAARVRPAPRDHGLERVSAVRAAGGTVVATGGCFDLLHAGHVRTLEGARRLGDCLVVCVNSDASVRRLKGADRPLVPQEERAAVLEALGCVDAVMIFHEDTPARALAELRPRVWVKGGDYCEAELPEAAALASWGGRCVVLPFVEGRSTTRLIEEARHRVAS